jgi:hypothetical protein
MLFEELEEVVLDVGVEIQLTRFVCVTLVHFCFASEYKRGLCCLKYLALHQDRFPENVRAFISANLLILTSVVIEALTIRYILSQATALDIVNNFIKLRVVGEFGNYFVAPFIHSPFPQRVSVQQDRHRRPKTLK